MTVPLDDKMVHRAFGIYETFTVRNSMIYNLEKKVKTFYSFANSLKFSNINFTIFFIIVEKLKPPFDQDYAQAIIIAVARAAKQANSEVTIWMSPGPGDYSLIIKVIFEYL